MVHSSDKGARWALIAVIVCSVALSAAPGAAAAQQQYGYGGESYDSYGSSSGGPGYVYDSGYQGSVYGPSYGVQDGYGYSGVGPKLCFQADSAPTSGGNFTVEFRCCRSGDQTDVCTNTTNSYHDDELKAHHKHHTEDSSFMERMLNPPVALTCKFTTAPAPTFVSGGTGLTANCTFSLNARECGTPASFRGFQADLVGTTIPSLACGPILGVANSTANKAYLVNAGIYQGSLRPSQEDGTDYYSHDDCTRATVRFNIGFVGNPSSIVPAPSPLPKDRPFVKPYQMIVQLLDEHQGYGY